MELTLACDHRILYGADAAEFLSKIRQRLEQPLRGALSPAAPAWGGVAFRSHAKTRPRLGARPDARRRASVEPAVQAVDPRSARGRRPGGRRRVAGRSRRRGTASARIRAGTQER
jgi:hypothetical protein